tara:strand:+ start:487 stop:816 length:330 start_codon:yes stop_codon:yes gene_type:complete
MKQDEFNTLREITSDPRSSQRKLASNLGFSLGKLNYCLNALRAKGLVKLQNFKNNKNKVVYTYLITPKGISEKTKLTIKFMKLKMREYDELKKELIIENKNLNLKKDKN